MAAGNSLILVVSDSHGNVPLLTAVLEWAQAAGGGKAHAFKSAVFLGDGADDIPAASAQAGFAAQWFKVRGNLDSNFLIPDTLVLEIKDTQDDSVSGSTNSRKLFMTHGNRFGVDMGGLTIAAAAKNAGAEAALFGHTHVPYNAVLNGIFLLNPGSIGRSRSDAGPTFAVLECPAKGPLSARFFCLVSRGRKNVVKELEL